MKLTKVKHVCQDSDDATFFGITIATTDSPTGYRMYVFKAEKNIVRITIIILLQFCGETIAFLGMQILQAADFVNSAREVVTFVQGMMATKKEQGTSGEEATDVGTCGGLVTITSSWLCDVHNRVLMGNLVKVNQHH